MAAYTGTIQVNDSTPQEVNKAILELLRYINQLEARITTLENK
jgi:hypothetical protein